MATRTNHHTAPILTDGYNDSLATVRGAMSTQQYNNAIKAVRRGGADIEALEVAALAACTRLGLVPVEGTHNVTTTPSGSGQLDLQSIINWLGRVSSTDEGAKAQVRAIAATATKIIAERET